MAANTEIISPSTESRTAGNESTPQLEMPAPGANRALSLLLAINLFNYVDRYILSAVEPKMQAYFKVSQGKMGLAQTAFLLSYMIFSPVFGFLGERMSRWFLVGVGVTIWSLASGATGLADSFTILIITRCFVGIGEAAYGPIAPALISDLFPVKRRGQVLSLFYLAIPVGGALGYAFAGIMLKYWSWRAAFYAVVPPGIFLGVMAFLKKDIRNLSETGNSRKPKLADYLILLRTPSYVLNTLGMASMTFAVGGIAFWMPHYIVEYRKYSTLTEVNLTFGGITVVAGLIATLAGGWAGDKLLKKHSGAYFIVSGLGMLLAFPLLLLMLVVPFPYAYGVLFLTVSCLFFNTGPTNAALANVTHTSMRATAFAINIFMIHVLGDAISPPLIGWMSDRYSMNFAFQVVSVLILVGGGFWLWGAKYLGHDTAEAPNRLRLPQGLEIIRPAEKQ